MALLYRCHEWCKHGTCAISEPSLDTESKYFSKVLKIYETYNTSTILEKGNIKPSISPYQASSRLYIASISKIIPVRRS